MDYNQEAEKILKNIGLAEHEIKIYLLLTKTGPQTVSNISKAFHWNRVHIYRNVRRLENRGLVNSSLTVPAQYKAIPFKKALKFIIDAKKEETSILEKRMGEMASIIDRAEIKIGDSFENRIMLLEGANVQILKGLEMSKSCEKEFCLMYSLEISDYPYNIIQFIRKSAHNTLAKNAKYRLLVTKSQTNIKMSNELRTSIKGNFEIRFPKNNLNYLPTFAIADEKQAQMRIVKPNFPVFSKENELVLWTSNQEVICTLKLLFDIIWQNSIKPESLEKNEKAFN